jgi:Leucine-rich repeat (LRR) protein
MIRVFFSLYFIVVNTLIFAQGTQQPFFKVKTDSIKYAHIQAYIQELRANWTERKLGDNVDTQRIADSLYNAQSEVLKKAEWRWVYKPRKGFVRFSDLKSGKANPDSIIQLSISDLRSAKVPAEVLLCKNLEELELVQTQIDELQAELNSLTKLSSIYLYDNVPSKRLILGKNNHVNYLRIAGHHPDKLPKSYKNFSSLDSLNINRSMTTRIPDIRKNKELIILNAVSNNITLKGYKRSHSLEHLDLRGNKVTRIPSSIGRKYKSLKALSFNTNPVKKVKPGLGKLKDLEYLSFYGNGITEIPAPVYQLSNLQVIDLFDNKIEFVSPQIKNLQQLRVLYLANNRLYRLPDEIGLLKNLEEVYVYNNRMDTLPASMDKLDKLRVLWVNDNFFHTIPATTWRVGKMDYLDASQNFIKKVPDEIAAAPLSVLILSGTLMNKERENPELFEKLRKQGTRIIYYRADSDVSEDDDEL